jgi:hypothetical protein
MAEWVDLKTIARRLSEDALLAETEAGWRLQEALAEGKISAQSEFGTFRPAHSPYISTDEDEQVEDEPIPAGFWTAVEVDWEERRPFFRFFDRKKDRFYLSDTVRARRSDALEFLRQVNQVSGTAGETAVLPPPSPTHQISKGGRPRDWDWEGAYIELARILVIEEGDFDRPELNNRIRKWFSDRNNTNCPSDSMIREKVKRFYESIWPPM